MKRFRTIGIVLALVCLWHTASVQAADECPAQKTAGVPGISAECAILMTGDGTVLYEKNAHLRHGVASTTKIMTALLALETLSLEETVTVPACAQGIEGSSLYLRAGEQLTVRDLLYGVMLQSANDAAATLAVRVSGSIEAFAEKMNERASDLGMENTHFCNPHGLPEKEHYSTAYDMGILTVYAMKQPSFRTVVSSRRAQITRDSEDVMRDLVNHNKMLYRYPGAVGVKTGFTKQSGRCLVSSAERDCVRMIAVTLNAPDDWNDHRALLDYGFSLYETHTALESGAYRFPLPVAGGTTEQIYLTNKEALRAVVPATHGELRVRYEHPAFVFAPVSAQDTLGYAVLYDGETELARCPLTVAEDVAARTDPPTFIQKLLSRFHRTQKHS